jgi:hypothetical protein
MAKKEVTLKGIVAAIDQVLHEIGPDTPGLQGAYGDRESIKKALKGIRETVEALCSPGFDIPPEP